VRSSVENGTGQRCRIGNVATIELSTYDSNGVKDIIVDLYTYYVPGVEIPTDEELMAQVDG